MVDTTAIFLRLAIVAEFSITAVTYCYQEEDFVYVEASKERSVDEGEEYGRRYGVPEVPGRHQQCV